MNCFLDSDPSMRIHDSGRCASVGTGARISRVMDSSCVLCKPRTALVGFIWNSLPASFRAHLAVGF
jgi:hypothetical protein